MMNFETEEWIETGKKGWSLPFFSLLVLNSCDLDKLFKNETL